MLIESVDISGLAIPMSEVMAFWIPNQIQILRLLPYLHPFYQQRLFVKQKTRKRPQDAYSFRVFTQREYEQCLITVGDNDNNEMKLEETLFAIKPTYALTSFGQVPLTPDGYRLHAIGIFKLPRDEKWFNHGGFTAALCYNPSWDVGGRTANQAWTCVELLSFVCRGMLCGLTSKRNHLFMIRYLLPSDHPAKANLNKYKDDTPIDYLVDTFKYMTFLDITLNKTSALLEMTILFETV